MNRDSGVVSGGAEVVSWLLSLCSELLRGLLDADWDGYHHFTTTCIHYYGITLMKHGGYNKESCNVNVIDICTLRNRFKLLLQVTKTGNRTIW